jgi:hypothetical protein
MFNHVNHGLILEDLECDTTPEGRFYLSPSGIKYPSVTTVLSCLDKPGLDAWKARVGEEEAAKILRQAGTRGTAVHLIAENYLNNEETWKEGQMPMNLFTFASIRPILD